MYFPFSQFIGKTKKSGPHVTISNPVSAHYTQSCVPLYFTECTILTMILDLQTLHRPISGSCTGRPAGTRPEDTDAAFRPILAASGSAGRAPAGRFVAGLGDMVGAGVVEVAYTTPGKQL